MNRVSPVRWVGGKSTQLPQIRKALPAHFDHVVEPFSGSAALSLDLLDQGRILGSHIRLNDANPHLMDFWAILRDSPMDIINGLMGLRYHHGLGTKELYQLAKSELESRTTTPLRRAIMFCAWNMMTVMGKQGGKDNFCHPLKSGRGLLRNHIDQLRDFSLMLNGVNITNDDYREIPIPSINTLVYSDSPYLNGKEPNQRYYGKHVFAYDEHVEWCHQVKDKCHALISYDDNPKHLESFKDWHIHRIPTYYHSNHSWGTELVITNYPIAFSDIWCSDPDPKRRWERPWNSWDNETPADQIAA